MDIITRMECFLAERAMHAGMPVPLSIQQKIQAATGNSTFGQVLGGLTTTGTLPVMPIAPVAPPVNATPAQVAAYQTAMQNYNLQMQTYTQQTNANMMAMMQQTQMASMRSQMTSQQHTEPGPSSSAPNTSESSSLTDINIFN